MTPEQCLGCTTCQERAKAVAAAGLIRRIHAATGYLMAVQAQGKGAAKWNEAAMQALTSATTASPDSGPTP